MKQLVERAQAGDEDAFATLYTSYFTPLFRYIFYRVKDHEVAEDLTQTIFVRLFEKLDSMDAKNPRAYLYMIARNIVIDFWKKKKATPVDFTDPEVKHPVTDATDIEAKADQSLARDRINRAMKHLSDDQREALTLRFNEQLSHKEISHIMNKTEATVRQLQCRGLKALRSIMHTGL